MLNKGKVESKSLLQRLNIKADDFYHKNTRIFTRIEGKKNIKLAKMETSRWYTTRKVKDFMQDRSKLEDTVKQYERLLAQAKQQLKEFDEDLHSLITTAMESGIDVAGFINKSGESSDGEPASKPGKRTVYPQTTPQPQPQRGKGNNNNQQK